MYYAVMLSSTGANKIDRPDSLPIYTIESQIPYAAYETQTAVYLEIKLDVRSGKTWG